MKRALLVFVCVFSMASCVWAATQTGRSGISQGALGVDVVFPTPLILPIVSANAPWCLCHIVISNRSSTGFHGVIVKNATGNYLTGPFWWTAHD